LPAAGDKVAAMAEKSDKVSRADFLQLQAAYNRLEGELRSRRTQEAERGVKWGFWAAQQKS
jgi:hypothetical protein